MLQNYRIYFLILFFLAVVFSEYNLSSDDFYLLYIINPVQTNFTLSDNLNLISNYSYVLYTISPTYKNFTLPNILTLNIDNTSLIVINPTQKNFTLPNILNLSFNTIYNNSLTTELHIYEQNDVIIVYNNNYFSYAEDLYNYLLAQNFSVLLIP